MATCPDCQSQIQSDDSFCRQCGFDLSKIPDPEPPQESQRAQKPTTKTITTEESVSAASLASHELKSRLQEMGEYEFEYLVADLWGEMGWDTQVSQASVDAGIDGIATKETPYHQKKVIQAKRYADTTTVGGPDIQQYASLRRQVDGADSVVVVTTSSFTSSAESRAGELNVKLVDGDDIVAMIDELDAYDVVDEYLDITRTVTEEITIEPESVSKPDPVPEPESEAENIREASLGGVKVEADEKAQSIQGSGGSTEPTPTDSTGFPFWHWVGFMTGVLTLATAGVSEVLFGLLLFTTVLSVYLDMRYVQQRSAWEPRKWFYLGGLLFALFTLPIYLINRYRLVSRE